MFDITTGEVGKVIRLNLQAVDESTDPPTNVPLNLTNASAVILQFAFGGIYRPIGNLKQVPMSITNALGGIVSYVTVAGDLDAPAGFQDTGEIKYVVKVTFSDGSLEYSSDIGTFTVKQKVGT